MTWTTSSPTTAATTTVTIVIRAGSVVSTLDGEIANFRQAVLEHRARMRLFQALQVAPRPLPPAPRAARPRPPQEGKKRLSMLGQAHRMGKS